MSVAERERPIMLLFANKSLLQSKIKEKVARKGAVEEGLPMHQNRSTSIQTILNEGIRFWKMLNNILAAGIFHFD